jgi:poly(A) polymerase Pap1
MDMRQFGWVYDKKFNENFSKAFPKIYTSFEVKSNEDILKDKELNVAYQAMKAERLAAREKTRSRGGCKEIIRAMHSAICHLHLENLDLKVLL